VRVVKLAAGVFGFLLYTWIAAVRNVPRVRRRKRLRRR
jgi:hypothetical protein